MIMRNTFLLALVFLCLNGFGQNFKDYAKTPPMGWNSWNTFAKDISEAKVMSIVDVMVSTGLKKVGYQYVVIDDGWALERTSDGSIVADPKKFPNGIKHLADYVHAAGLKFGIYTSPAAKTCGSCVGSLGHEEQDVQTYAAWGVDFIKLDGCGADEGREVICKKWRAALDKVNRPIVLSIHLEYDDVAFYSNYANMWRTTNDMFPSWDLSMDQLIHWRPIPVALAIDMQQGLEEVQAPGTFNDPDMLQVGNGSLTYDENVAHFSMWAILGSPLMLGNDLRNLKDNLLSIISNNEIIAINQDHLCYQGRKIQNTGIGQSKYEKNFGLQVWAKKLSTKGEYALVLLNRSDYDNTMSVNWTNLGLDPKQVLVRDLWKHKDLGSFNNKFETLVPPHNVVMLKVKGKMVSEFKDTYPVLNDSLFIELEEATLFRAVKGNYYHGFKGWGYIQFSGEPPTQYARFAVHIPNNGKYKVGLRYANPTGRTCTIEIQSNNETVKLECPVPENASFEYGYVGAASYSAVFTEINLKKGLNVLKVKSNEMLAPLLDQLILIK